MEDSLDPVETILYAQVSQAGPNHGHDEEGFLRPKAHQANIATVWLGDIATTLLRSLEGASTPIMSQRPGFDEQKWELSTTSGSLDVKISSFSYWGFGLFTKCYANIIHINGPLEERARVIFDLVSASNHKPWEFSRAYKFSKKIFSTKENELLWKYHIERARTDLTELIEHTKIELGDSNEIEMARNALADDNAPAVIRALSRMEAESIEIEVEDVIPDGQIMPTGSDEIPIIDLTNEEE
ncbi:MAG: hypothetical protein QGI21_03725 [Candidatus Poseidoniaceae archaeon]|jgi:hypothetical protein|nr:hypothetical protein [Candidatus Poseidoniaceae archaeon]